MRYAFIHRRRYAVTRALSVVALLAATACTAGLTDVPDPSTIIDPNVVNTQDGAVSLYYASASSFAKIFGGTAGGRGYAFALASGFAGDEFSTHSFDGVGEYFMQRLVEPGSGRIQAQPYSDMHTSRLYLDQAIGALRQYGKTTPKSYIGELFVLKGYLYVMFGEMYCSGIPFSRAIYGGDVAFGTAETTTQMFEHAIAQFDTAIAVATDSVRIRNIAAIGKGRALLDLGRFDDAAAAITAAAIPTDYGFAMTYTAQTFPNYINVVTTTNFNSPEAVEMGNRLGTNGLDYLSAGDPGALNPDPRVEWRTVTNVNPYEPPSSGPVANKLVDGSTSILLGSGVEARLIEAEAALAKDDIPGWVAALNALRQNAITPAIAPLTTDSTTTASDTLRENVMFRERAFWLYGTGHRLGDLRRLVRQYHRAIQRVFPIGEMVPDVRENGMFYVDRANFAPPESEVDANPYYQGCLNRDP